MRVQFRASKNGVAVFFSRREKSLSGASYESKSIMLSNKGKSYLFLKEKFTTLSRENSRILPPSPGEELKTVRVHRNSWDTQLSFSYTLSDVCNKNVSSFCRYFERHLTEPRHRFSFSFSKDFTLTSLLIAAVQFAGGFNFSKIIIQK